MIIIIDNIYEIIILTYPYILLIKEYYQYDCWLYSWIHHKTFSWILLKILSINMIDNNIFMNNT
jgi:hypothetical protein